MSPGAPSSESDSSREPSAAERIHTFLLRCSTELTARAETEDAERGAAAFAGALDASTPLTFEPGWLPVLDTIDHVDPAGSDLASQFTAVAPLLPWIPTKRATDGGNDFALSPLNAVRDFGPTIVGLMYVRAGTQYPLHHHAPQELYLTMAGTARWRYGGSADFVERAPGRTVYNHPDDLHSSIAGDTPLVAFYVLWDDGSPGDGP